MVDHNPYIPDIGLKAYMPSFVLRRIDRKAFQYKSMQERDRTDPAWRYEHSSSEEFEKQLGITGIARHYRLPGDMAPREFAMRMDASGIGTSTRADTADGRAALAAINKANDELVELNPELGIVRRDRTNIAQEVRFRGGVAFRFSPQDIDYYISSQDPSVRSEVSLRQRKIVNALLDLKGITEKGDWGWFMSPATIGRLESERDRLLVIKTEPASPDRPPISPAQPAANSATHS